MQTSRQSWLVWAMISLFLAYQYALRIMPSVIMPHLLQQFHMDAASFGQFSGSYYLGYALMHLPLGILLDRYQVRHVLVGCILLIVIGLLPMLFAHDIVLPLIGRCMVGMGSSAAVLGLLKVIPIIFDDHQFTKMLGLAVTIGLIGAIYGSAPIRFMTNHIGYQSVIYFFIFSGLLLACCIYSILPKQPPAILSVTVWKEIRSVLMNKQLIGLALAAGFMVGPLEGFADVWGYPFLHLVCHLNDVIASFLPSLIFIGMGFGSPLLGMIAEKSHDYLLVILGCSAAMAIAFGLLLIGQFTSILLLSSLFAVIGFCCGYQILVLYLASKLVDQSLASLATATANMIIMLFGYAFHSAMGFAIDLHGGPFYPHALITGVSVIPAALCLSSIFFWYLRRHSSAK